MKVYTKTGDSGSTSLVDSSRVLKSDVRIAAVGACDEANADLGLLAVSLPADQKSDLLETIQSRLFDCGAFLANPSPKTSMAGLPDAQLIQDLEQAIDTMSLKLPPLTTFILPGGREPAARAHVARVSVRRAERAVVALKDSGAVIDPQILSFLNRLSDWLFVLARFLNHQAGLAEIVWKKV